MLVCYTVMEYNKYSCVQVFFQCTIFALDGHMLYNIILFDKVFPSRFFAHMFILIF